MGNDHDMEDLREVLKVAREEVPGLLTDITGPLKELMGIVFTMTEEEAEAMLVEAEEKLSMVKDMCICKNCPTYVAEETEVGFCHPLVGKSKIITEEKGCNCPTCPVYTKMGLKNGFYCTRKSEMEQDMAKKA